MIDVDELIRDRADHLAPLPNGESADWNDVLARAGLSQRSSRRTPRRLAAAVVAVAVAAAALVAVASPVRGAISRTVDDFSAWLLGQPGEPASKAEQQAFEEANERSWVGFPGSPQLRRLIDAEAGGVRVDLLGFRGGSSLCLRLVASGDVGGSTLKCAPVSELELDDAPVRVLVADWAIGRGDKEETIGFDTVHSARVQVTAGIAADGVRAVELVDEQGTHRVEVRSNAFLYVADRPEVGQRVSHIRAELESGRTVGVPFAVSPWGPGGGLSRGAAGEPGGPTKVERVVQGGRIGWVERREERGEPVEETLTEQFRMLREVEFARLLTPDEGSAKRVVIAVGQFGLHPPGTGARPARAGICYWLVERGSLAGSCAEPDKLFERWPFSFGYSVMGAGDQFATFQGVASDDVARLEIFTGTGNQIAVPLRDNAYLVEVSLARLPAKMVAFDAEGRAIGIAETQRQEGSARPIGKPVVELSAAAPGVGTLELRANRTREGGECWAARGTGQAAVNTGSCVPKNWQEAPLRLATLPNPAVFVFGRARADIVTLVLEFADGQRREVKPGKRGYVLEVVPQPQRRPGHDLVAVLGLDAEGAPVQRQLMKPRPG